MYTIRKASGKVFGCKIRLAQPVGKEIKGKRCKSVKITGNQHKSKEGSEKSEEIKGDQRAAEETKGNQRKTKEHNGKWNCPRPAMYAIRKASGKVFGCKPRLAQPVGNKIKGKSWEINENQRKSMIIYGNQLK